MSTSTSPTRFIEPEDEYISDANFRADISKKMRVPNKISMVDYDGEIPNGLNPNWLSNSDINMQVPDRILVMGQDQHLGTRAPPREINLDDSLLPHEPEGVRVNTPPRMITLDKYQFPVVDDNPEDNNQKEVVPIVKPRAKFNVIDKESLLIHGEPSPSISMGSEGLTPGADLHIRKQMAKLNRRVMALELYNIKRQQKDKIVFGVGIVYFLLKAIFWLNRS